MKLATTSRPITACQICGNKKLTSIIFLGFIPPVNTMPKIGTVPVEEPAYPLELLRCNRCTLVQIGLEVDARVLFPPDYPYLSASTRILRDNFADLGNEASRMLKLKKGKDLVVDIGSNDGTLLSNFVRLGFPVLGIEPSKAAQIANRNGVRSWMKFFSRKTANEAKRAFGPAKVITAANVFAHIGDVHSIVRGITDLLDKDGVFINESHYVLGLIQTVQYDTVYHEHLRHYSLGSLMYLFKSHGLEVFHVKRIPTHGGSIRVYAARKGTRKINPSVAKLLKVEKDFGLGSEKKLFEFRDRVVRSKHELYTLLGRLKNKGARIFGVGAPSRASTLVNYVGLDDGLLDCVVEIKTSHKVGKYIPGTRVPVIDEERLFREQPEFALFLSWHIAEELAVNLRKHGYKGKFIVPLPRPRVLSI